MASASLLCKLNNTYIAGGVVLVGLGLLTFVSKKFGKSSAQYTSYFQGRVSGLINQAVQAAREGNQTSNKASALEHYTRADTILEALSSLMPEEAINEVSEYNMHELAAHIRQRKAQLAASMK